MATRASFQGLAGNLIGGTFKDFADAVVFTQAGDFNDATETYTITETNETTGIRLNYSKSQFDGSSIEIGDYKIVVEQQSVSIDIRADNVEMTFNNKAVTIVDVQEDAARAAYTIQARAK